MTSIHLSQIVKRFGDFTALQEMDLRIHDGEFIALLGPSGCGKSTTMNIIAGMEDPSEGRVMFGDRDVTALPMQKRGVGFVFQNYAIFTHMTVRENLAYGPRMHGAPRAEIERRVVEMADFLDLGAILDRPSAGLSVNILQRLAIGRSAIMEPAIFLLDEPLSNVDAAFRAVMRRELKSLQQRFEQTMVYVTHDQLEAMTMADRIAVMDHGVLQQVGTPLEVYNAPANLFVAQFLGAPGMNLLPGMLDGDGIVLEGGGRIALDDREVRTARRATGRDVVYGFRPEEARMGEDGVTRPVSFVERIGARTILHMEGGIKAVFENDVAVAEGRPVTLSPNPGAARIFDAGTGARLEG
ncbi:ABC transporter ATP-binding protein [Jannaschia sp. LMIT008]|uniref:ABC transporter ATP-binding protein n=1 Tax=Jannaschia maritima TaxID=3032585 RepID=UPI002812239A|nr:ABC transporter ATP-binding protein [Jannaschia sp. LMIT008]